MSVVLRDGTTQAEFLPELGLLGTSLTVAEREFVALPGGVDAYRAGHQTGVPLLAPWANRIAQRQYRAAGVDIDLTGVDLHTDAQGLPIHGMMTAATGWQIVARDEALLRARFDYGARPDLLHAFPFPHGLEVEFALVAGDGDGSSGDDGRLTVTTTLRATGDRAVPVAFGWHPYLRLPVGRRASWRLVLPDRDHLELDARGIPTGASEQERAEAEPIGERTFDDLYALGDDRELAVEGDDCRLVVRYEDGYPFAQVFAPPKAEFVCLEPMTAATNALATDACPIVAPGSEFTARFSIVVTCEPPPSM